VPAPVWHRSKQPYRAPGARVFFAHPRANYLDDLLSHAQLSKDAIFNPDAVGRLVQKFRDGKAIGVKDDMALVGILSTQIMIDRFINNFSIETHGTPYSGTAAVHCH